MNIDIFFNIRIMNLNNNNCDKYKIDIKIISSYQIRKKHKKNGKRNDVYIYIPFLLSFLFYFKDQNSQRLHNLQLSCTISSQNCHLPTKSPRSIYLFQSPFFSTNRTRIPKILTHFHLTSNNRPSKNSHTIQQKYPYLTSVSPRNFRGRQRIPARQCTLYAYTIRTVLIHS